MGGEARGSVALVGEGAQRRWAVGFVEWESRCGRSTRAGACQSVVGRLPKTLRNEDRQGHLAYLFDARRDDAEEHRPCRAVDARQDTSQRRLLRERQPGITFAIATRARQRLAAFGDMLT